MQGEWPKAIARARTSRHLTPSGALELALDSRIGERHVLGCIKLAMRSDDRVSVLRVAGLEYGALYGTGFTFREDWCR